ncbi:hypothetical protein [Liquorilactobacillus nagelii]|uniref:hypothetical protein n=1 Tax=Liquorilactobacillus nagelii TaxID=82688 RepID=UPI0039E8E799
MRGVSRQHGLWQVRFYELSEYYQSESEANARRVNLENQFNFSTKRIDYAGQVFGNLRVIGDTGKEQSRNRILLTINTETGKLCETWSSALTSGNATGKSRHDQHKHRSLPVGVYKNGKGFGARITLEGRSFWLGTKSTLKEAEADYKDALNKYNNNGQLPA